MSLSCFSLAIKRHAASRVLFLSVAISLWSDVFADDMAVQFGAVNGALIHGDESRVAIYGWDGKEEVDAVLLTHSRRDVIWKAEAAIQTGAVVVAPAAERFSLEQAQDFWETFPETRFHDYRQQTTKIAPDAIEVRRWVKAGEVLTWPSINVEVIDTPGYSRGAVTYISDLDGQRVAFTGDLIYAGGRIPDLYSFQDAIPEAQIRGYHGYGARLAALITSLRKVAAARPDVIVPARGPVIRNPQKEIDDLISRVQALYRNYLSTNALHWYFKKDRMQICAERILGPVKDADLMPYAHHEKTPEWIYERGTSRLLISETGNGFLLDCGNQGVIDTVQKLIDDDVISRVEGIFVTHYHDDHTDSVQKAAETFGCPVYATSQYADVLSNPTAYHLPAMTANAIRNVQSVNDGHRIKWREFDLTFHFFPGQTWYHGALMVRKPDERPVFFIGDAFAPSGFDDYCVLNRNLVGEDNGYLYCLKKLRSFDEPIWLVNEHIPFVFSFTEAELDYLESRFRHRIEILKSLFPWDSPNYGIDEQWAVIYPRGAEMSAGDVADLAVQVTNHSPRKRTFEFRLNLPQGTTEEQAPASLTLEAGQSARAPFRVRVEPATPMSRKTTVISADVASDGMDFRRWCDALLNIKRP